jgi:curved DNA-binding protein CbpA
MWIDPFTILGVDRQADDAAVKRAYLEAVKAHSPEQDPEGFQRCRAAYEKIASKRQRLAYCLTRLEREPPPVTDLLRHLMDNRQQRRPNADHLRAVLAETAGTIAAEDLDESR